MKKKTRIFATILITTIAAILCAAILVTVIYHHDWFASPSSSTSIIVSKITETIVVDQTASEATPSTESTPQETSSQPTSSVVSTQSSQTVLTSSTNSNAQTSSNDSGEITASGTNENQWLHPTSGLPFKQIADPDTGISWDGVSPIIYTYPDGTTSTEKKDGATYEALPGMITTYNIPRDLADREIGTICPVCQKEIQFLSRGIYCTQTKYQEYCGECGDFLQVYKCHTCTTADDNILFCTHCGKRFGDGTGGTCVRWLMGDVDCPMCGEHVEAHTCHSCDE